jgi:hypothetical protein
VFAQTQGDLQLLPNGDWWLGWGDVGAMSEVSPTGTLLFDAVLPHRAMSYRTLRFPWTAVAPGRPALAARRPFSTGPVALYASWNGATEVARWRVLEGASAGALTSAGSVARSGFETELHAPAATRVVAVVALDGHGRSLGRSAVVQIPVQ